MGNKCCADRKCFHRCAGMDRLRSSISYHSEGPDGAKFMSALESRNLQDFVALLPSLQPIDKLDGQMHPWAENPRTIGALAGTQLALIASTAESEGNFCVKDEIREAGGIPLLVQFLESGQTDRIQIAVVAMSFLTAENSLNGREAYDAGAMPLLIEGLKSNSGEMRVAIALTLRNISMVHEDCRTDFVKLGGIDGLVAQLSAPIEPTQDEFDVQLDAILNLQDILEETPGGECVVEHAKLAAQAGAIGKLRKLADSPDEDVSGAAKDVLTVLETVVLGNVDTQQVCVIPPPEW